LSRTNSTYQASPQNFFPFSYEETIGESAPDDFLYVKDNHLGSVLTTVSDRKLGVDNVNNTTGVAPPDGLVDFYLPDVVSATDMYCGGMQMPGRSFNPTAYRHGFGGYEKDDEVSGNGNAYYFEGYGYDPRLVRRKGMDPKYKKYPDVTPYSCASNNPILFLDKDGKEVIAYTAASQSLVLKTLNYAFGTGNGFSFENNKLIHNANAATTMTPQQTLMFKYFNEVLVKSDMQTVVNANETVSAQYDANNELQIAGAATDGGAVTFLYPASKKMGKEDDPGKQAMIERYVPAMNDIMVPADVVAGGITVTTEHGVLKFSSEHVALHEFAHAMVNVIMNEMGGKFNDVDFNQMTPTQRSDWSINYTNTLLRSVNIPLETGTGQHGRAEGEAPAEKLEPITK